MSNPLFKHWNGLSLDQQLKDIVVEVFAYFDCKPTAAARALGITIGRMKRLLDEAGAGVLVSTQTQEDFEKNKEEIKMALEAMPHAADGFTRKMKALTLYLEHRENPDFRKSKFYYEKVQKLKKDKKV